MKGDVMKGCDGGTRWRDAMLHKSLCASLSAICADSVQTAGWRAHSEQCSQTVIRGFVRRL